MRLKRPDAKAGYADTPPISKGGVLLLRVWVGSRVGFSIAQPRQLPQRLAPTVIPAQAGIQNPG